MQENSEGRDIRLIDIWNILWQNRKFIILVTGVASVIAVIITLLISNWYKATVVILPPSKESNPFATMRLLGDLGLGDVLSTTQDQDRLLSILKSHTLLRDLAVKFDFQKKYETDSMEETIKALSENLMIGLEKEMQISVSFLDRDQDKVADYANYIVDCLDSLNIYLSTSKAAENRRFIEARVNEVIDSLKVLENDLSAFMKTEGILSIEDQIEVGVKNAAELKADIMRKEIELAIASNTYNPESPVIGKLKQELKSYRQAYDEFFEENSSDNLIPDFTKVPELSMRYKRLERQIEYYIKLLEYLAPQYESAKIEEAKDIPMIQVLDHAVRPEKKDRPRRSRIVLGIFILALAISSSIVYFRNREAYFRQLQ